MCFVFNKFLGFLFFSNILFLKKKFFYTHVLDTCDHVVALCNPWCTCHGSSCTLLVKSSMYLGNVVQETGTKCRWQITCWLCTSRTRSIVIRLYCPPKLGIFLYFISWAVGFLLHALTFLLGCCQVAYCHSASFQIQQVLPVFQCQDVHPKRKSVKKCFVVWVVQISLNFKDDSSGCVWSSITALGY